MRDREKERREGRREMRETFVSILVKCSYPQLCDERIAEKVGNVLTPPSVERDETERDNKAPPAAHRARSFVSFRDRRLRVGIPTRSSEPTRYVYENEALTTVGR